MFATLSTIEKTMASPKGTRTVVMVYTIAIVGSGTMYIFELNDCNSLFLIRSALNRVLSYLLIFMLGSFYILGCFF